jgi:formylglycine-generating enzyme required for sulfatase activity
MKKNVLRIAGLLLLVLIFSLNSCTLTKKGRYAKMKPYIEWVNIPAGTFTMGSPVSEVDRAKDEPQHQVTLSAFKMSKYEITFDQYDSFCKATGRTKPDDAGWGRGKRPVINVNWYDAAAFAEFMGCRLPTEAEWEYACRAGTTTPFYTGNNLTTAQANYDGTFPYNNNAKGEFRAKTLPVGSFEPNPFGLYDMYGNVWEWCNDWYGDYPSEAQTDPKGPESGFSKIQRGGCWGTRGPRMRSATRDDVILNGSNNRIGFRLMSPM